MGCGRGLNEGVHGGGRACFYLALIRSVDTGKDCFFLGGGGTAVGLSKDSVRLCARRRVGGCFGNGSRVSVHTCTHLLSAYYTS